MEENIIIRKRGGGCIVQHPPVFSSDGKYIYVLSGWSVSAYNVQTGECVHQFKTEKKSNVMCLGTLRHFLISACSENNLIIWNTKERCSQQVVKLGLEENNVAVRLHPVSSQNQDEFRIVVTVKEKTRKELSVWLYSLAKKKPLRKLYIHADDKPNSTTACEMYAASFVDSRIQVVSLDKNGEKTSTMAGSGRWWTSIACTPEGTGLAAGDNTGRIVMWSQPLRCLQTWAVFHWHTLPVNTISFSPSGSYMYSGGAEGVLVRWNVEVSNVRNFLPRLPAPILHVTVSPDNQSVAISTQDNGILLADSQNQITSIIQKLTCGVSTAPGSSLFPAGLLWDTRSRSIVLNGRPGHLQFFSPDDNKLLYNLDICGENYLSKERDKLIMNAEVSHVALSHDGKWMVTVETRDDKEKFLETLLKFWQYKFNARQYSLNTCYQNPHGGRVNVVKFQPPEETLPDQYLLVTTGADSKFRLWIPSLTASTHSKELRWVCDYTSVNYKNLPPLLAAFSSDGSVLGVTFGPTLTLWDADIYELKNSFTLHNDDLKVFEFGSQDCSHLFVTGYAHRLYVWSLLSPRPIWTVPLHVNLLCADPFSSNMAVLTSDNSVYVFSPSNQKPLFVKKELCQSGNNILAAIFVPRPQILLDTSVTWCRSSQLHFIDSNQELQYLELESEQDPEQIQQWVTSGNAAPLTAFNTLKAEKSSTAIEKSENKTHVQFGTSASAAVRELLSYPTHTMPPIETLCYPFLLSLVNKREPVKKKEDPDKLDEEIEMDVDEDSDGITSTIANQVNTKKNKCKKLKQTNLNTVENSNQQIPKNDIRETPKKKKQRRKANKEKKTSKKKESSFSMDDLDSDWLSVLEKR